MSTGHCRWSCSELAFVLVASLAGCSDEPADEAPLVLTVCDVGQGLAQLLHRDGTGIACDIGSPWSASQWHSAYRAEGSPVLAALAVSHSDTDHTGGLAFVDTTVAFSGAVYVTHFEDTARVLAQAGPWRPRLRFHRVGAGDTIAGVPGVHIDVLWPPQPGSSGVTPANDDRNAVSMVLQAVFGQNRALITGDADTVALRAVSAAEALGLRSELVVAPHHGSASGVDRVFYGYACPDVIVVSCGKENPYGHPSELLVDLAFEMHVEMRMTWRDGSCRAESQGYHWTVR